MQKSQNCQSSPVLLRFCRVSVRPDQEKALQSHSGIINDVLRVNGATALLNFFHGFKAVFMQSES